MKILSFIDSFIPNSLIRILHKFLGVYKAPIWFYIKIFINDKDECSCFIDNEMIFYSDVNSDLMKIINKKLKLKLEKKQVNWIDSCRIELLCKCLNDLNLNVHKDCTNKNNIIITVSGSLSEKDIKTKLKY